MSSNTTGASVCVEVVVGGAVDTAQSTSSGTHVVVADNGPSLGTDFLASPAAVDAEWPEFGLARFDPVGSTSAGVPAAFAASAAANSCTRDALMTSVAVSFSAAAILTRSKPRSAVYSFGGVFASTPTMYTPPSATCSATAGKYGFAGFATSAPVFSSTPPSAMYTTYRSQYLATKYWSLLSTSACYLASIADTRRTTRPASRSSLTACSAASASA